MTAGLIAALRRRGLAVQPFKVGPDYIDPGFLSRAAGHPARNLDAWLLDAATLRWVFDRHADTAAVTVVEGMMGLFDGLTGGDDTGSTAHVARLLNLPVVLVLDASRAARSVAAVARGCQVFDRRVRIAGWILNRVAGETHRQWVVDALERTTGKPVFGALPEDPRLAIPERHLGLVQAHEAASLGRILARCGHEIEARFDLKSLLRATRTSPAGRTAPMPPGVARLTTSRRSGVAGSPDAPADRLAVDRPPTQRRATMKLTPATMKSKPARAQRPVIAWARDDAFTFHYADNIELLEALGARVVPWSPLGDRRLPAGTSAIVLGGGYPELYAAALADNRPALNAVRTFARRGGPVYAECGGLMYLARGIAAGGRRHRLSGIVPAWARMTARTRVAYVRAETVRDTILASRGTIVRGHEFHASSLTPVPRSGEAAYRLTEAHQSGRPARWRFDGYSRPGVLASYVHLNFLSDPRLAAGLVASASAAQVRGV